MRHILLTCIYIYENIENKEDNDPRQVGEFAIFLDSRHFIRVIVRDLNLGIGQLV